MAKKLAKTGRYAGPPVLIPHHFHDHHNLVGGRVAKRRADGERFAR
jgi:hypothetical protein